MSDVILYTTEDGKTQIDLHLKDGTVWLSQQQIADLFQTSKQNISKHVKAIYEDQELDERATVNPQLTVQKEGSREVSRTLTLYNLDVILAVGYRVRSARGMEFRRWASTVLKEYLEKGFAMNDERLKNLGGGNYWKELLDRIRDIRSSEKVMYRQVLDLYAIEQREMRMADYVRELDSILNSTGRKLLENAGTISSTQAQEKAKQELQRYKAITLDQVEKDYLKTISSLEKQAKKATRKKGDKHE